MKDYNVKKVKNYHRIIRPDGVMLDNLFKDKKQAEEYIKTLKAIFKDW